MQFTQNLFYSFPALQRLVMPSSIVDLRSDTVTRPTAAMKAAIQAAPVGDDIFGDDPTVNELHNYTAEILGKEAAIFMPSGTMTNQIAVRIHCKPGDEFLCEADCHIYNYEQGGFAQLSGVVGRPIESSSGVLRVEQVRRLIRPENDHLVRTKLVCVENTHNRGGGRITPYDQVADLCAWAHTNGLRTHLDGARLFNAVAATGIPADRWAQHFDTVSVCFSKGLGAPVGSALAGPAEMIVEARRHRKLFGGSTRQAGVIAAGALFAMHHHRERLVEDHANAQILAQAVRESTGLTLSTPEVETNIVIFHVDPDLATAAEFVSALAAQGVWTLAIDRDRIRAVTHLDVDEAGVRRAAELIPQIADQLAQGIRPTHQTAAAY